METRLAASALRGKLKDDPSPRPLRNYSQEGGMEGEGKEGKRREGKEEVE